MLEAIRIILAMILLFFLPGILLVQAVFPRKGELDPEFDWLYRLGIGIGLSIVLTILVGFGLNSLGVSEETGLGYVSTWPIVISLLAMCAVFFFIGWLRGGYQFLGKLHPALIRFPPPDPMTSDIPRINDKRARFKHQELEKERFKLINDISATERLLELHSGEQRSYYEKKKEKQLASLTKVEEELKEIESGKGGG